MRWIPFCLVFLVACADTDAYERVDPHTAVATKASQAHIRVLDRVTTTEVRAVRMSHGNHEQYLLKTFVARTDRNYPKISSAYSRGNFVEYQRDDRHRRGAFRVEAGHILMTRAEFARRARTGFSFRLSGPRGVYPFNVPPEVFASVLTVP